MSRNRALISFVLTIFASLFLAGAAGAALACATPVTVMVVCGQDSDCDRQAAHDCALACAPMCAAVEPSDSRPASLAKLVSTYFPAGARDWVLGFSGPDPPPPRMG